MIDRLTVYQAVEEKLAGTDYFIVDVNVSPANDILVEIDRKEGVDLDFCAELSRYIEAKFDREAEDFSLEVGSAGITQAFKVLKQYEKNLGNEVEVLSKDGRKLSGILKSADETQFTIEIAKQVKPEGAKRKITVREEIPFHYDEIKYTKYIIRFK
ncbi:MAG: ribosome assembly cofactor RimP [Prevotellaceae bacterium]|jgi:ribosome maturation factor RimP|nr:ribosome assembly cofactor RimP [Prevotellaceae bacterium]